MMCGEVNVIYSPKAPGQDTPVVRGFPSFDLIMNPAHKPNWLVVTFRGRTCYLGNTLPFRLLARLAHRPGCYVTHDDLFTDVWDGAVRSGSVIRGTVKVLRQKLREAGMGDLAAAIDGSVPGRYALRPVP
jgi:hypothetical protein